MSLDNAPIGRLEPSVDENAAQDLSRDALSGYTIPGPGDSIDLDATIVGEDSTLVNIPPRDLLHNKGDSNLPITHSRDTLLSNPNPSPQLHLSHPEPTQHLPSNSTPSQARPESELKDTSYEADLAHDTTIVGESAEKDASKPHQVVDDDNPPDTHHARSHPRPHNLELNLKPPSPQPWDLAETNFVHSKGPGLTIPVSAGAYSPVASHKFSTMQSAAGNGKPLVPKSSYYFGPPGSDSAYGTAPIGQIGVHHPREILRVERDYTGGEIIQFAPIYPLELENRLTPTQFLESINAINEILISAHSLRYAFWDNFVTVATLQLSRLFLSTHFQKEMKRLRHVIDDLNVMLFNPVGLNILWPGDVAFLFLEIEYY